VGSAPLLDGCVFCTCLWDADLTGADLTGALLTSRKTAADLHLTKMLEVYSGPEYQQFRRTRYNARTRWPWALSHRSTGRS
jgi:hypothetical protein